MIIEDILVPLSILVSLLELVATACGIAILSSWAIFLIEYLRGGDMDRTLGQIVEDWIGKEDTN